jgi:ketosteroid isomerase-like protein
VSSKIEEELIGVAQAWDRAIVQNDADAIGHFMADDWTIVGSDGSMFDKATFLGLIRSGALSHNVMESEGFHVRIYGNSAVVIARGSSGGTYKGQPFHEFERSSCVFVRQEGRWQCVLTHLSRLARREGR